MTSLGPSPGTPHSSWHETLSKMDTLNNLSIKDHKPIKLRKAFEKKMMVNQGYWLQWFEKCHWLHYTENDDTVVCITCV